MQRTLKISGFLKAFTFDSPVLPPILVPAVGVRRVVILGLVEEQVTDLADAEGFGPNSKAKGSSLPGKPRDVQQFSVHSDFLSIRAMKLCVSASHYCLLSYGVPLVATFAR